MSVQLSLPARRNYITQKIRIGGRTLYISAHDDQASAEIFLRVKGNNCTPETIALYDIIARLMSIVLQYDASLEQVGDLLIGAQFAPCGPVSGHDRMKHCSSLPELMGQHLSIEYCGINHLTYIHLPTRKEARP